MFNSSLNNPELVESYKNGSNWYRIYSDGWIEQGGATTFAGNNGQTNVNFLKPFANTNYNVQATCKTYGSWANCCAIENTSASTFKAIGVQSANSVYNWHACGQGG